MSLPYICIYLCIIVFTVNFIKDRFDFDMSKLIAFSVLWILLALFSAKAIFVIDYKNMSGNYYYGVVLMCPFLIYPFVKFFKRDYLKITNFMSLTTSITLMVAKLECTSNQCCGGIELFTKANGEVFFFPSRFIEGTVALLAFMIFYKLTKSKKQEGMLYGYLFIFYGIQRMIFEYFRILKEVPSHFGLPVAYLWCTICVVVGIAWLILVPKYKKSEKYLVKEAAFEEKMKLEREAKRKAHSNKKVKAKKK